MQHEHSPMTLELLTMTLTIRILDLVFPINYLKTTKPNYQTYVCLTIAENKLF